MKDAESSTKCSDREQRIGTRQIIKTAIAQAGLPLSKSPRRFTTIPPGIIPMSYIIDKSAASRGLKCFVSINGSQKNLARDKKHKKDDEGNE